MQVTNFKQIGTWRDVADAARTTVGKEAGEGEPSSEWKRKMLKSQHSPIRLLTFTWTWEDLPYWVAMHIRTHHIGIEHFVQTQRDDRIAHGCLAHIPRGSTPQDTPVKHRCTANAQAILNISRERLCSGASKETRAAWSAMLSELSAVCPELHALCVPKCVFQGHCPEAFSPCGYVDSVGYKALRLSVIKR
jgi:hypothetical protein